MLTAGKTTVLALDCAMENLGVALWQPDTAQQVVFSEVLYKKQSEKLHPVLQGMLAEYGWDMADIGLIVVTRGPGSFTGIRVGMAAAQGLALGLDVPLVTLTTLQALAKSCAGQGADISVWIQANGENLYVQQFDEKGNERGSPGVMDIEEALAMLAPGMLLCGSGAFENRDKLPENIHLVKKDSGDILRYVDPLILAREGYFLYQQGIGTDIAPVYLSPLTYKKQQELK